MRHLREIHREPILTWDTWKMKHSSNGGYKSILKKPKNRRLKRTSIALNVKILSKGRDSSWNMKSTSCSYIFSSGLEEYCISSEKSLVCKKRGAVHFCMKPCTQKLREGLQKTYLEKVWSFAKPPSVLSLFWRKKLTPIFFFRNKTIYGWIIAPWIRQNTSIR